MYLPLKLIDYFLDRITMYRLMLYVLLVFIGVAAIFGYLQIIPYTPMSIIGTTIFLTVICYFTNIVFAYVFKASTNMESVYITGLILSLIFTPMSAHFLHSLPLYGWVAVWAMASKYIFAIGKKHLFNPVAITAVLISYGLDLSPSWWVGNLAMAPFVMIGGALIVRKIRRVDLVFSFIATVLFITEVFALINGNDMFPALEKVLFHSSLFFFGFVMLTEPLTTPPTNSKQIWYGSLVGLLFSPQFHLGSFYTTPEIALVIGNIFSYLISPKQKLLLHLKEKIQIAPGMYDFIFAPAQKMVYVPGQYMEWTLSHPHTDSRGNRRYFSIASSPTEDTLRLGIKFYEHSSSFKHFMLEMNEQTEIVASQLAGDFTLPKDAKKKLVFLAGGIGITPFRSILKYLVDKQEVRTITLIYSNRHVQDIVYEDIFDQANQMGMTTIYTLTDTEAIPPGWQGKVGRVTPEMIKEVIPDWQGRMYYLSGPHSMVTGFHETLKKMGVKESQIKKDYFPGLV